MLEHIHPVLSLRRQCGLLSLNRSGIYYQPASVDPEELLLMHLIDEQYTKLPFYGSRRMKEQLCGMGYPIGRERVQRLMRLMGLQAVFPGPNLSRRAQEHKVYPYLLKGLDITCPNQVWSTDITYIRLAGGFLYLVAIIDWFSRYVLAWRLSNSLDSGFCVEALEDALQIGKPDIFNSDQGAQFTSEDFTGLLLGNKVAISMDSKGRALDNIFVERLWRSVKYEEVYLNDYQTVADTRKGLGQYFEFYNKKRYHQALDYRRPYEVHFGQN
jgi:putative transposase